MTDWLETMPLRNKMGRLRHMTLSFSSILINLLFPLPTGSLSSAGQHNDCCEIKIVVLSRSPPSSCQAARLESVNYFYNNTHPQAREEPPVDITISKINYQTKLTDQTWPHPILLLFLFFLFSLSLPRLSRWLDSSQTHSKFVYPSTVNYTSVEEQEEEEFPILNEVRIYK